VIERDGVRAVFFDAGYTLLCMDPPQTTVFLRVCADLGIAIDAARLEAAIRYANELLAPKPRERVRVPFSQSSIDAFWTAYHRAVLQACARDAGAADRGEVVYERFTRAIAWRVYDDVRPLLRDLRARGLVLGVISNWTGDLDDVLSRTGLRDAFDVVLDSARFGYEKPHPEIFAEAVRSAAVAPADALHVGDSIEHDVEGASGFGMRAVLIDRANRHAAFARAPRIDDLARLRDHL